MIRIALLPTEKAIPLLVAEAQGLFGAQGLAVYTETLPDAYARDRALRQGSHDVVLLNCISIPHLVASGVEIVALTVIERATTARPMFLLLRAPAGHGLPTGSAAVVATSIGTVAEFVACRLGTSVFGGDFRLLDLGDIQERAMLVSTGRVQYAVLPEPHASQCLKAGCVSLADEIAIEVPPPLLVTSRSALGRKSADFAAFRHAYEAAIEICRLSPETALAVAAAYDLPFESPDDLPDFPSWQLPSLQDLEPAVSWARRGGGDCQDVSELLASISCSEADLG